ncbi:hypothetical protein NXS19_009668 [Fusarium pseudograminearum]|nr:hypothetical protein NXS19_009668 [Fusarium pseudograminearum]
MLQASMSPPSCHILERLSSIFNDQRVLSSTLCALHIYHRSHRRRCSALIRIAIFPHTEIIEHSRYQTLVCFIVCPSSPFRKCHHLRTSTIIPLRCPRLFLTP